MPALRDFPSPPRPDAGCRPLAGAGTGTGHDAAAQAADAALRELGSPPSLLLLFCEDEPGAALAQAEALAPGAVIAGMTASGGIGVGGAVEQGCSAIAFCQEVEAAAGVSELASRDPRTAGRSAAREAFRGVDPRAEHALLLLFIDTASGDQSEVVAGAYEVAGPRVPLAGGAAGGPEPAQLGGGRAARDRVVAVAITSPDPIGVGVAHGCTPCSIPSIVTRADGNRLLQLDGRPAEEVYLEKLGRAGEELDGAGFRALAAVHPLAQPELRGDVRLRHVLDREEGALVCATAIPPNAAVEFTFQTPEAIARSTFDAVSDALRPLGSRPARAALVFDCGGRRAALGGPGEHLDAELEALLSSFGKRRPPLAGLYTRGEIGRVRGAKGDRNHAVVVAAFG